MRLLRQLTPILFIFFLFLSNSAHIYGETTSYEEAYQNSVAELAKHVKEPGTYEIELTYDKDGETLHKTVRVTVTGKGTVVENDVAIDANPFTVTVKEASSYLMKDWIESAGARAWKTTDNTKLAINDVDASKVVLEPGSYPITFKTVNQVETTIIAEVVEKRNQIEIDFENNQHQGFETIDQSKNKMSWKEFEVSTKMTIMFIFVLIFFIPIVVLFIQYVLATNLVKRVIQVILKKE